jgi:hypothetical protein
MKPRPLRIIVYSRSSATLAMLCTMLCGFQVTPASSLQDVEALLKSVDGTVPLDFVIVDDQSEIHVDNLARILQSLKSSALQDTKIIHLYTPTTNSLSGLAIFKSNSHGVLKMTKPPREARLLQILADLKNLPNQLNSNHVSDVTKAKEALAAAQRTIYGNVLIAEGTRLSQQDRIHHYFLHLQTIPLLKVC